MRRTAILVLTVAAQMVALSGAAFAVTLNGTAGGECLKDGSDQNLDRFINCEKFVT